MIIRLIILLLAGLILTIMPLPDILIQGRPPWILLIVLYVQLYLPNYFNVAVVFTMGIMLDSLLVTVIGEHALALCVVTWLANSKARRFALFPMGQQMGFIGFFAMAYQLIIVLIDSFLGDQAKLVSVIGGGVVSVLVWPWLRLMGEEVLLTARHSSPRKYRENTLEYRAK
ncbi:MAG: rod shape-determining protein MreD [Legionellales bacterium RIFCSPHIGHO2_12_FULL_42_9]|nr:MAG: rod shape-determining protein MreD [Legionellales bacterium RIFCSPHIGHO2_12_FULL_42_9]